MIKKDDIIITKKSHSWYSCLLIVDEVKSFGVTAHVRIPCSNIKNDISKAYIRIKEEDYQKVGSISNIKI